MKNKITGQMRFLTALIIIFTVSAAAGQATADGPNRDPEAARLVTSDIDLFWKAFDRATPENDLIVYRDEYLKKGSEGLREFWRIRIGSPCELVDAIERHRAYYAALRPRTARVDSYKPRIRESFRRLAELYPEAVFPDVYFLIGRMNSAGTLTDKGLLIGLDMFGRTDAASVEGLGDWHRAVVSDIDRIPHIVAHELIHYQQKKVPDGSLLARAIGEGSADFVAELISGRHTNAHLHEYGDPRERELWLEFRDAMDGTDLGRWLYQGDKSTDRPADLGYYVGYKITESYYRNAPDKKRAIREILNIGDHRKFLAESRYAGKFEAAPDGP